MADTSQTKPPLVRYGEATKHIPGDPYGEKLKHAGNVSHRGDIRRKTNFTKFQESDYTFPNERRVEELRRFLEKLARSFVDGTLLSNTMVVVDDTDLEKTVRFSFGAYSVEISQYKDVAYTDRDSYYKAQRARLVEEQSAQKIMAIEPPMGRNVENYMMALVMHARDTAETVVGRAQMDEEPKERWYKALRMQVTRAFWMEKDREERDLLRREAKQPSLAIQAALSEVVNDDKSHSQDFFRQHYQDAAAVAENDIYAHVDADIAMVVDKDGEVIMSRVSRLFQLLFGAEVTSKVTDAVKSWSAIPPLPQPEASRHMVDEIHLQNHPEINLELATIPEELEQRAKCVVHYGTRGMQGHGNPADVYLTPDTRFVRGSTSEDRPDYAEELFPVFKRGVLGISSDVARFLIMTLVPDEYKACLEIFEALPEEKKMSVSEPDWASLIVLGINSFTERHEDRSDVKYGMAALVALGEYEGGDFCFPQLARKVSYQPGDCLLFRGAELEHFVSDWTGCRIFLIFTNHQAVRKWAWRRMGREAPLPSDPWFLSGEESVADGKKGEKEAEDEGYDPCVEKCLDIEADEELSDKQIHGASTWSPGRNLYQHSSSSNSSSDGKGLDSVALSFDGESDRGSKRRKI